MSLKKIAELANVSVSTVSRVINGKSTKAASKETQEKIFRIARELSYVPNAYAQNLKQNITPLAGPKKKLGIIFGRTSQIGSDPFFTILARSIEKEVIKRGFTLTYTYTASEFHEEVVLKEILKTSELDGAFVLGRMDKNYYKMIREESKHMVYAGLNEISHEFDQVIVDGYSAAMTAVHHLYQKGHRQIGYIGEKSNETRYKGYYDAMEELELKIEPDSICHTKLSADGGYVEALKMIDKGPLHATAFFCANDLTAIGAIKAFSEKGYLVPKEISVIGIDDIETAQLISPSLTTIHIPLEEMGKTAAKLLLDRISEGTGLPLKVELPYTLIQRESVSQRK